MCADFVCLHVPKIQSAQKENPQAAVRIFIWHLKADFFIKQLCQKVLFLSLRPCVFHGAEPWLKGFVRCVRNARSPFVALSLRVVATMCALALVGQGDRFCHFKGPISNSCCCPIWRVGTPEVSQGMFCGRCKLPPMWRDLAWTLETLGGKSLEVAAGNWTHRHTTVYIVSLFCVFVLASLLGLIQTQVEKKQIHEYSHSHFFMPFYLSIFEAKKVKCEWQASNWGLYNLCCEAESDYAADVMAAAAKLRASLGGRGQWEVSGKGLWPWTLEDHPRTCKWSITMVLE